MLVKSYLNKIYLEIDVYNSIYIWKHCPQGDKPNENLAHWLGKSIDLYIGDITKVQLTAFIEFTFEFL